MGLNQLYDVEIDKINKPTLPLASGELTRVFREWVREVCRKKGLAEEQAAEAGGKLYTSGSWRLGVHEPGADIDVVCVAPRHCTRVDFFATLKQILELSLHLGIHGYGLSLNSRRVLLIRLALPSWLACLSA